jgi:hypothetical protein
MKPTRTFVLSAVRIVTVPLVLCATTMVSVLHTIFAAPPGTLHLDVFIDEADSWNVTSTLIYGKSEAIVVDSQFRISQAKKLRHSRATETQLAGPDTCNDLHG